MPRIFGWCCQNQPAAVNVKPSAVEARRRHGCDRTRNSARRVEGGAQSQQDCWPLSFGSHCFGFVLCSRSSGRSSLCFPALESPGCLAFWEAVTALFSGHSSCVRIRIDVDDVRPSGRIWQRAWRRITCMICPYLHCVGQQGRRSGAFGWHGPSFTLLFRRNLR